MKTAKKARSCRRMAISLAGVVLTGSLTGCGAGEVMSAVVDMGQTTAAQAQECTAFGQTAAEDTAWAIENAQEDISEREFYAEQLSCYKPFGLAYDEKKNVLTYNGKRVRYFEDFYPVGDDGEEAYAGTDFFDEKGVVDVCAVRDFSGVVRAADGSFDPGGRLTGLRQCSDREFRARDIEALVHPPVKEATAVEDGEPASPEEMEKIAAEYAPFGVTYDAKADVWYYKDEKIHVFQDILMSNGESATGGRFSGSLRQYNQEDGTVDICTVRDFEVLNAEGNGTLKGIECRTQKKQS